MSIAAAAGLPAPVVRAADRTWMRRLHLLLGVQSVLLVLASLNRLTGVADAVVLPHGSLRVLELVNLLVLPPLSAANFLHERFCDGSKDALCQAVAYQDNGFSHALFFVGFAGIDAVLLVAAVLAPAREHTRRDLWLVLANASLVAAAIVANLGFETIGLDLMMVAAVAVLALVLLRRCGPRPVIAYFAWAYAAGLVLTLAVRLV